VEVLAQMQGLAAAFNPANNNNSFFGNTSSNLFAQTSAYTSPADASNALVVIWVNNADLYYPALYYYSPANWTNVINQSQTNHYKSITNLYYAKGIRTLVMPNVVDISTIPQFDDSTLYDTNYLHQQCINYNIAFANTLSRATNDCPGLKIYPLNYFSMLTNLLANPLAYGLTNLVVSGQNIDAINAYHYGSYPQANTNGYGTNYVFWDPTDPTAKVHYIMATNAQNLISSPVKIGKVLIFTGSNQLDLVNIPAGITNSLVLGCTDMAAGNWTTNLVFTGTNTTQTVTVPASGPQWFYRLSFPMGWVWP
jgi:phospholipase/lecithinase/hemolysin